MRSKAGICCKLLSEKNVYILKDHLLISKYNSMSASCFKGQSGVDKIIVKKQPYQLLNVGREFFPSFDATNFHKLVMNLRKLGQISSPFCILY